MDEPERTLTGSLGVGTIVFMVMAASAPLTVIAGAVPVAISIGNGAAFPATFALTAAVLLLFAVGFAAMSRHVPEAGAFYSYVERGLGRATGLGAAFLALATYTAIQLAVYGYIGVILDGLVRNYGGPSLPWWLYAGGTLAVVAVLGYRHIELSGRVLGALLIGEIAIVGVLDTVVIGQGGGPHGLSTALLHPAQIGSGSFGIAIMFAIASYLGFETTAVFRSETRDPDRTVPRATYLALIMVGGFYTISAWVLVSALGDAEAVAASTADPANMALTIINQYLGRLGGDIAQVLLATSMLAAIISFHNVLARYLFTLGRGGVLPEACGVAHNKHRSPYIGSCTQSVSALIFLAIFAIAGLDPVTQVFSWMVGVSTLGFLTLMVLTCVAVIVFFRRELLDQRTWNTRVAPGLSLVGLAICLGLTVKNFPILINGSVVQAVVIGGILVACFTAGVLSARGGAGEHGEPHTPDPPGSRIHVRRAD